MNQVKHHIVVQGQLLYMNMQGLHYLQQGQDIGISSAVEY